MFTKNKLIYLYIIAAYTFGLVARYLWIVWANGNPDFFVDGELMINTNDGYYFASGVQKELFAMHESNPRVPSMYQHGLILVTTIMAKFLPFSLNTIILYMPGFISSLVVIPIILIAKHLKLEHIGFFAALIATIGWSYYNRTMYGYYDTDMFAAMLTMFLVYFSIMSLDTQKFNYIIGNIVFIIIYPYFYDQGLSIVYAMSIVSMICLFIFNRHDDFTYKYIINISIALLPIEIEIKVLLLAISLYLTKNNVLDKKQEIFIALALFIAFLIFGNMFGIILNKILAYVNRGTQDIGLHFYQVNQTVREAGKIPFETLANRISGHSILLIVSTVGYALLVKKYKSFVVTIPLISIGFFAYIGGLRFTVYAVPVMAIALIYFFHSITTFMSNKKLRIMAFILLCIISFIPNLFHIITYSVPTVFTKSEVKALSKLKDISSPKDYTITWWDYGYPIWYYSDTNTLIDGGKHDNDNFLVSKILTTTSQNLAHKLSRLSVETYVDSNYSIISNTIFNNMKKNQLNPTKYLEDLENGNIEIPKKSRDIFLYLPLRMLNIFKVVDLFSSIDLQSGKKYPGMYFFNGVAVKKSGNNIVLNNGIQISLNGTVNLGIKKFNINKFITTSFKTGTTNIKTETIDSNSPINVIFMQDFNRFLVVDERALKSLFVQMFVLDKYNHDLFEKVVNQHDVKIFKVR